MGRQAKGMHRATIRFCMASAYIWPQGWLLGYPGGWGRIAGPIVSGWIPGRAKWASGGVLLCRRGMCMQSALRVVIVGVGWCT